MAFRIQRDHGLYSLVRVWRTKALNLEFTMKNTGKPVRLDNRSCVYCGADFGPTKRPTREHVVGLNFVPRGSFESNDWNLIVWACWRCNHEKSKLEGEISAITLQPGLGTARPDERLNSLVQRKAAKTLSAATGKTVQESAEKVSFTHRYSPAVSMTFGFTAPPRLLDARVAALAGAQIGAFFYLITYDDAQRRGSLLPGGVTWFTFAQESDWGNAQLLAFASLTRTWKGRVGGNAAKGYFRIVIRREPSGIGLWCFALEWNKSYRIVGFFGDRGSSLRHVEAFPPFEWSRLDQTTRCREESPLGQLEDVLFECQFED